MTFPFGEPVTVLTRAQTGTDRYGNAVYGWPEPGTTYDRCAFAPGTSTEPVEPGRTAVLVDAVVYLPAGAEVGPADRLIVRGVTYEVQGEPGDWRSPYTGNRPGVAVPVRRVEG